MRNFQTAKALSDLLHKPEGLLGFYYKKAQQLIELNQLWQKNMDPGLVAHSHIANLRDHCLIIEVANAVWASRLRYWIPDLLVQLNTWPALLGLKNMEWYIQPHMPKPPQFLQLLKPHAISQKNSQLLVAVADTIPQVDLRGKLHQLALIQDTSTLPINS